MGKKRTENKSDFQKKVGLITTPVAKTIIVL